MAAFSFCEAALWVSSAFSEYKTLLEHSLGFHNDALHVFAGVAIQVLVAAVLKRSLADWRPFLVVLLLELANEANDLARDIWPNAAMQAGEGLKDLLLTIVLPAMLLVLARYSPSVLVRRPIANG